MQTDVYFDLETGGLELTHPIIQIAAVAIERGSWGEIASFETKLQFNENEADPAALAINHYTPAAWAEAIPPCEALARFNRFLRFHACDTLTSARTGRPYTVSRLKGYNSVAFDMPRIKFAVDRYKMFLCADLRSRDVMQIALWYFDQLSRPLPNYRLETVAEYFELEHSGAHDALFDVRLTVQIAKRLDQAIRLL